MTNSTWSCFTKRIPVKASREQLYLSWTTREGLEKWFLRKAPFFSGNTERPKNEPAQKGDHYLWLWHGYPDDVCEQNEVLEANGVNLFRFVFTGNTMVSVSIKQEQGQNIIELVQENIVFEEDANNNLRIQCATGWTFYLTNLKSVLENGYDLRNKDEKLKNVVTA